MRFFRFLRKLIIFYGSNEMKIKYSRKAGVKIGRGCSLLGRVEWGSEPYLIEIGDNVRITDGVTFVTHDGGVHVLRRDWGGHTALPTADVFGRIKVGSNVFVGIRTIIMPGVTIGDNVVIGAGSIVTKDVPSNTVVCGIPAKPLKTLDEYAEKIRQVAVPTKGMKEAEKRAYLSSVLQ